MVHRLSFLILAGALLSCAASTPRAPRVAPFALPPIAVSTLDGKALTLDGKLRGSVSVVSLWATWCEACEGEFDALNRLHRKGGLVVGVAVGEERGNVAAFVAKRGLEYVQLVDEDFHLVDALGERRVPATLVVDRRGSVVYRGGLFDETALAAFRAATEAKD